MYHLNPYLTFNGNCAEAFRFYQELFGASDPMIVTFGESPMAEKVPAPVKNKIMHAALDIGPVTLMGADAAEVPGKPESTYRRPQGLTVSIHVEDPADAERVFGALCEGGEVQMPIGETFWARRFGMCTDRFGIPWMVNCSKPQG